MFPTCGLPWSGVANATEEAGGTAIPETADLLLPRGPDREPEFDENTDCGNCGFERPPEAMPCERCGSANTAPEFRPTQ